MISSECALCNVAQQSITDKLRALDTPLSAPSVLRILVLVNEVRHPMPSPQQAAKLALHKFQRIAVFAATAGFAASTLLIFLKLAADRLAPANAQLQSSFEAACALLWPSAIILLGAQTFQGGLVLFLLSAVLNAGYFVFASMFFAAVFDKTHSRAQVLAPVSVTRRSASHRSAAERPASSRSVA